ncbi:MAG: pentapeptide repeat-containing protein [Alphaproteobacteria bacterium]|nr:pentapeptide repeat-containing protein [Alphaproteobacteria bacterium]
MAKKPPDPETDPFKLAEQKRWLDLARLGKDAWNSWAEAELNKPLEERARVDLSDLEIDIGDFEGFVFPGNANFFNATFSGNASFHSATFSGNANFIVTAFSGLRQLLPRDLLGQRQLCWHGVLG